MSENQRKNDEDVRREVEAHYGIGTSDGGGQDEESSESDDKQAELPANEDVSQSDQKQEKDKTAELWDKRLQKFDQLLATHERNVKRVQEHPTEKNVAEAEKSQSKLQKYINANDDIDPYRAVPDLASEMMADRGRVERLSQDWEAKLRMLEERQAEIERREAASRFRSDFPAAAERYHELIQKASEAVAEEWGTRINDMKDSIYGGLVNKELVRLAKQVQDESHQKADKATDTARKPRSAQPIKNKSGNSRRLDYDDPEAEMAKIRQKWDQVG